MDKKNISNALAIGRTELANERNFLAYFRTFVVLLSSGFAIYKLNQLSELKFLAFFLMGISIFMLLFGAYRYFKVKKRINTYKAH